MKQVALKALNSGFADGPTVVVDEFAYANGRADVVIARASEAYLDRRIEILGISSNISRDVNLQVFLQLHHKGPMSREYFHSVGALDRTTKNQAINWLIKHGFVHEVGDGKIQTAPHLRRHVTTSYSIELKLKNWKKALEQAIRGKSFADYQFVALPSENVLRAVDHIEDFEEHSVGLIEISRDGEYFVHHWPERQSPYSLMNKWRLNEETITKAIS